jgi:hypothetical protein
MPAPPIARAQLDAHIGHVETNLDKHLSMIKDTQRLGVDFAPYLEISATADVRREHVPSIAWRSLGSKPGFGLLSKAGRKIGLGRSHRTRARAPLLCAQLTWWAPRELQPILESGASITANAWYATKGGDG